MRNRKARKPGFSLERHIAIGRYLKLTQDNLVHLAVEIGNAYPVQSDMSKLIDKTEVNLRRLRGEMENTLYREYGDIEDADVDFRLVDVYFGDYGNEEELRHAFD